MEIPEQVNKNKVVGVKMVEFGEGGRYEGLCPEAEMLWTAFLIESKLWEVVPPVVELCDGDGAYLGKAVKKYPKELQQATKEGEKAVMVGEPTYIMIETDYPELENALLAKTDKGFVARKFGTDWESSESYTKDKAGLEKDTSGSDRLEEMLSVIELYQKQKEAETGTKLSVEEVFDECIGWVRSETER